MSITPKVTVYLLKRKHGKWHQFILPFFIKIGQFIRIKTKGLSHLKHLYTYHHMAIKVEGISSINSGLYEAVNEGFLRTGDTVSKDWEIGASNTKYFSKHIIQDVIELEIFEKKFREIIGKKYDFASVLGSHFIYSFTELLLYIISFGCINQGIWINFTTKLRYLYCNEVVSYLFGHFDYHKLLPIETYNKLKS